VPLKAVIFDIDGTLYPNRSMMIRSAGFFLSHLRLIRHFSQVRKDLRKVGRIEHFESTQAGMLASRMGISPDEARHLIEDKLYGKWERVFRKIRPWPGVHRELLKMAESGLRLGILSDFPVGKKLDYFGLQDVPWEIVFSSRDSGYLKPSIRPFLYCAEKMNLPPEQILYVGNNYNYDVVGARKAGMKTAWITDRPGKLRADMVMKNFRDFSKKLIPFM